MNEQIVSRRRLIKLKEWRLNIDSIKIVVSSIFTLRTDEN